MAVPIPKIAPNTGDFLADAYGRTTLSNSSSGVFSATSMEIPKRDTSVVTVQVRRVLNGHVVTCGSDVMVVPDGEDIGRVMAALVVAAKLEGK